MVYNNVDLKEEIEKVAEAWAKLLNDDLKASFDKAVKDGGSTRPQINMSFKEVVNVDTKGDVTIQIIAKDDYWQFVEYGVDGTKKKHGSPFAYKKPAVKRQPIEDWIKSGAVNPKNILLKIEAKRRRETLKGRGLSLTKKKLSKGKIKGLSFDESSKRLSYVFARSIADKGHEPKPFIDRVLDNDRILLLTEQIGELVGRSIFAEVEFLNEKKLI